LRVTGKIDQFEEECCTARGGEFHVRVDRLFAVKVVERTRMVA